MTDDNLKIVFVCSEAVPFAKTGGMADVVGSLPEAISKLGHAVSLIIPLYGSVDRGKFGLEKPCGMIDVPMGGGKIRCGVYRSKAISGVDTYLIDHSEYFGREFLYGTPEGDYSDNDDRFAFFSRAALQVMAAFNLTPDVIHCHDWQTGLIPAYIRMGDIGIEGLENCRVFFTVHNLAYQGNFDFEALSKAGLPDWLFRMEEGLEFYGNVSYLKGGIVFADVVTTVSPSYSREIQKDGLGLGFEGILRARADSLHGIVNGIDYKEWNPETDRYLPVQYGPDNLRPKREIRKALLERCGLKSMEECLVVGMISRLAEQKGLDILSEALPRLLDEDVYLVILGFGDKVYHDLLGKSADRHPDRLSVTFAFDNEFAHMIYAGSDIFLMPSRYEPCGLGQLIAMKYGTPPLVRATGGLKDTVTRFDPETGFGTGFVFEEYTDEALLEELKRAVELHRDERIWRNLISNAMSQDYSWDASALQYIDLYREARQRRGRKLATESIS